MEPLHNRMARDEDRVAFHPEQIAWLEKMFPEVIHNAASTPAEMYIQAGVRRVIATIRDKKRV